MLKTRPDCTTVQWARFYLHLLFQRYAAVSYVCRDHALRTSPYCKSDWAEFRSGDQTSQFDRYVWVCACLRMQRSTRWGLNSFNQTFPVHLLVGTWNGIFELSHPINQPRYLAVCICLRVCIEAKIPHRLCTQVSRITTPNKAKSPGFPGIGSHSSVAPTDATIIRRIILFRYFISVFMRISIADTSHSSGYNQSVTKSQSRNLVNHAGWSKS